MFLGQYISSLMQRNSTFLMFLATAVISMTKCLKDVENNISNDGTIIVGDSLIKLHDENKPDSDILSLISLVL